MGTAAARVLLMLCAASAITGCGGAATDRARPVASHPDPLSPMPQCPRGALPLTPDAPARAADATLREAPRIYRVSDPAGIRVLSAVLESADDVPRYALVKCGRRAHARTVFVELFLPTTQASASLSQGRVQASRFRDGWHVWNVFH
jgi:hypothetical protein